MKMRENSLCGVFLNATPVAGAEEDAQQRGVARHHLPTGPFWPVYPGRSEGQQLVREAADVSKCPNLPTSHANVRICCFNVSLRCFS